MILSISVFIRAKQINGTKSQITAVLNGKDYSQYPYQKSTVWITPTDSYMTYEWKYPKQFDGSAWTTDAVNSLTAGVEGNLKDGQIRVTQIYIVVYESINRMMTFNQFIQNFIRR